MHPIRVPRRRRLAQVVTVATVAFAAVAVAVWLLTDLLRDPQVYLLVASEDAEWIVFPELPSAILRPEGIYTVWFSTEIEVAERPAQALLHFRTFRTGSVMLDGRPIDSAKPKVALWKQRRTVDLAPHLEPGTHTLEFEVLNQNSFAALWAVSPDLNLATNEQWTARAGRDPWVQARSAHRSAGPPPSVGQFEPTYRELLRLKAVYLPLAIVLVLIGTFHQRGRAEWIRRIIPTPGIVRWSLLAAWTLMCVNNLFQLPGILGYDVQAHADYMRFILAEGRLPLATDGWEMFQPPLYYLVSLPLYWFLTSVTDLPGVLAWLRVVPMLCALLHIEVAYRSMRLAFPERPGLQTLGLLVASLLPMNLFLSQTIGNETLCALFTGLTVLMVLKSIAPPAGPPSQRDWILLGFVWGLALLTKSLSLLLAPAVAIAVLEHTRREYAASGRWGAPFLEAAVSTFVTAFVLAGWFYVRNWLELGKPFHIGWDPALGISWWQDPGYRTPEGLLRFGAAVVQPIYAVFHGFWDGFYSTLWADGSLASVVLYDFRPPWNYGFLLAGALLAIVPTALLLIGGGRAVLFPKRALECGAFVAVVCLTTYLAVMVYYYVRIPLFSVTKATVTMGLASCYGILIASGFDVLGRIRVVGTLLWTIIILWAISAYAAFFVVST